jgi:hypothetical protein
MSSGISTSLPVRGSEDHKATPDSAALKPWQFFLLAGMLTATAAVVVATGQPMASIVALSLTVVATSLVGLTAYRMLLPFVGPAAVRPPEKVEGQARAVLEREKTLVLRAIKDLEFDRAMGKVAQSDFDEMSARLRSRAVGLLQQLDGVGAHRERIERELAERLSLQIPAFRARTDPPPAAPVSSKCASCGTSNDLDAKFCKQCGGRMGGYVEPVV